MDDGNLLYFAFQQVSPETEVPDSRYIVVAGAGGASHRCPTLSHFIDVDPCTPACLLVSAIARGIYHLMSVRRYALLQESWSPGLMLRVADISHSCTRSLGLGLCHHPRLFSWTESGVANRSREKSLFRQSSSELEHRCGKPLCFLVAPRVTFTPTNIKNSSVKRRVAPIYKHLHLLLVTHFFASCFACEDHASRQGRPPRNWP